MAALNILSVILLFYGSQALHTADFYTAAVYEHINHCSESSIAGCIQRNLNAYEGAARYASLKGADIIVFPESALMPSMDRKDMSVYYEEVPKPLKSAPVVPCHHNTNFSSNSILFRLSCIARGAGIYVVANMGEKIACAPENDSDCRPDVRKKLYNTNVVFDPSGTLIARHRKTYLFFEFSKDSPREPDYTVFNTSFGSFGVAICFESLYKPTVDLVEKYHVENLILSVSWVEGRPFGSAVECFQGFALGNKVNVLVAGKHNPSGGGIGSSIISGTQGTLAYSYDPRLTTSKLLVARVPRKSSVPGNASLDIEPRVISGIKYEHTNISGYTLKRLEKTSDSVEACNKGVCCHLNYTADLKSKTLDVYFGAYNGTFDIHNYYFFSQEMCIVVVCEKGSKCTRFPTYSDIRFDSLHLRGNISTPYQYPNVVASEMTLVPYGKWNYSPGYIGFESGKVDKPLLSVSLHGRAYERDPPYPRH